MILYDKKDSETGKEYAYRVLKNNIMCLELKPGDSVNESDLAEQLNVSRTPIREVLIKLKGEHLIEVKPQAGTYVSRIDWRTIEEAVFVRSTLEREALKEACKRDFSEDILIEMEKCLFAQKLISGKEEKALEFQNLDKEFHKLLFVGLGMINVWECINTISSNYSRMRFLAELHRDKKMIVEQHGYYLEIIKDKAIDRIDEVIDRHIKDPVEMWRIKLDEESVANYIKK